MENTATALVEQKAPVIELLARPGMTIAEVLSASLPDNLKGHQNVIVYNKGVRINHPDLYYFNEGDRLAVYLVPEGGGGGSGGKSGIKAALQIIVGIILIVVTWGLAAAGVLAAGSAWITAGYMLGASMALGGLASLIAPPPSLNTKGENTSDSNYYAIAGQSNQARFYQPALKLYGRHKMFPALATLPRIDSTGSRSRINALYDWGMGEVKIEELKIGETLIKEYSTDVITYTNTKEPNLQFVGFKAHQDKLALETKYNVTHTLTTLPNTVYADVELMFGFGCLYVNDKGEEGPSGADFKVRYRDKPLAPMPPAVAPPNFPTTGTTNTMGMGMTLSPGQELVSPQGFYKLIMQLDGNLVAYSKANVAVWDTATQVPGSRLVYGGSPPPQAPLPNFPPGKNSIKTLDTMLQGDLLTSSNGWYRFVVQGDGNCVIYGKDGDPIWSTNTGGNPGARFVYSPIPQDPNSPSVPAPDFPSDPNHTNQFGRGYTLSSGEWLRSSNGWYLLHMQGDGNLVLLSKSNEVIWSSKTYNHPGARLVWDTVGYFRIYTPDHRAIWAASTKPLVGDNAVLQDDGNFVVYNGGTALWSVRFSSPHEPTVPPPPAPVPPPPSGTPYQIAQGVTLQANERIAAQSGAILFVMQGDGNAVVYDRNGKALWASGTAGNPGARFVYDHNGNLVVISNTNRTLWFARTQCIGGLLIAQDDGNLVLYAPGGRAVWHTGTQARSAGPASFSALGEVETPAPYAVIADEYITQGVDETVIESPNEGLAVYSARAAERAGGLYVYGPNNRVLWHRYVPAGTLVLQGDGNLVCHNLVGGIAWNSGSYQSGEPTNLPPVDHSQTGTLKVYTPDNKIAWEIGSAHPGNLVLQDDGNLVIYTADGAASWASNSADPDEPGWENPAAGNWINLSKDRIAGMSVSHPAVNIPFNAAWYIATYPEVGQSDVWRQQPYQHYVQIGKAKGYQPGPAPARSFRLYAQTRKPIVGNFHFYFPYSSRWEIEITRTSPVADGSKETNAASIVLIESDSPGPVMVLPVPHTFTEVKLLATGKLSGVVQNMSAIATSVLNIYDANGFVIAKRPSRNPAWICIDILVGSSNPKPLPHQSIDWPAWLHLANYCDELRTWNINGQTITAPRHQTDIVIDYLTTIKELVNSILSACRAMLTISLDGKYSVAIDSQRTVPRQLITSANSWDFSGSRQFVPEIHGVRVSFLDQESNYQKQEIIAYRDGYSVSNASIIEDLGTFGVTSFYHAWAFGRYHLACIAHRSEIFTLKMDVENLAFGRGDLVAVAHDVPQVGGLPCKVADVQGNEITINEKLSAMPSGYTVRLQDGSIRQGQVLGLHDDNRLTLDNASGIQPDDLIVVGDPHKVVKNYMVQSIAPEADLVAEVSLLPYVEAIYDADIGAIPEWDPGISGGDFINKTDLKVVNLVAKQALVYRDRRPIIEIELNWQIEGLSYGFSEVYLSTNGAEGIHIGASEPKRTSFYYEIDVIKNQILVGRELTFEVVPITTSGLIGSDVGVIVRPT